MKKISEQLEALLKRRALKLQAQQELVEKVEAAGRVFDADESTAFDQLDAEIKELDAHAARLQALEDTMARTAAPVSRGPSPASRNRELPKGVGFARLVQLIAVSQGNDLLAQRMAIQHFPDAPDMARYFEARALGIISRAATTAATTADPAWAGTLVYAQQLSGELIELVRAETILGQMPRLRRVPFNVRIPRETLIVGSAQWVGEGQPKPVGKGGYDFVTIPWAKAALIVAITEELARFSNPDAQVLMRDGLVRAVSQFLDTQFIGSGAPIAGVSPGGILNGLPPAQSFVSAGDSVAAIQYDVTHAVQIMNAVNAPRAPTWIMSPSNKVAIAGAINAFGQPAFPSVLANGTLAGYPIVTSGFVPNTIILLVDQDKILHATDDQVAIDVSREASIQIDTAPADPPTPLVSLWQQNLIGLRAEKYEYWMRALDVAVVEITAVSYGTVIPAGLLEAAAAGNAARAASAHRPPAK
jgi:HK97 family phage major capsid protein